MSNTSSAALQTACAITVSLTEQFRKTSSHTVMCSKTVSTESHVKLYVPPCTKRDHFKDIFPSNISWAKSKIFIQGCFCPCTLKTMSPSVPPRLQLRSLQRDKRSVSWLAFSSRRSTRERVFLTSSCPPMLRSWMREGCAAPRPTVYSPAPQWRSCL